MSNITLKQLLLPEFNEPPHVLLDVSESKKDLQKLQDEIKKQIPEGDWGSIQKQLFEHLEKLLDIPLAKILTNGWNKVYQVTQVIHKQNETGSLESSNVELFRHKLNSEHHPKLQILINKHPIKELPLTISLELKLYGVILEIQQGNIRNIKAGKCDGKGIISYKGAKLREKKFPQFELPGNIVISTEQDAGERQINPFVSNDPNVPTETTTAVKSRSWMWILFLLMGFGFLAAAVWFLIGN